MWRHIEGTLWLVSLISLALAAQTFAVPYLKLIAVVWAVATITVVPLHFWRAWRRLSAVPNKHEYALCVGVETLLAAGLAVVFVLGVR